MRVPGNVVDGRSSPFPQGNFLGTLGEVKENWSEDGKNLDYTIALNSITPIDPQSPQVGARPFTTRITVIFQNQSIVDLIEFTDTTPFALQRAASVASQLAVSLGYATRGTDGSVDFNTEEFLENLLTGSYKGRQVGFEVTHRNWTSKKQKNADGTPKTGTSAELARLFNPQGETAPVAESASLREARVRA